MAAQEVLLHAMETMCCVYTKDFQSLDEMAELQGDKELNESIDLLLCDPRYNVHCQQDLQNSNHELLNARIMKAFYYFADLF